MIRLLIATGIMVSPLLLWRGFVKEYSIYRYLKYCEPLTENAKVITNIGRRYEDYLAEECMNRRIPLAFVGMYSYVALQAASEHFSISVPIWIARVVIGAAVTTIVSLVLVIVGLRFRRRYDGEIEFHI